MPRFSLHYAPNHPKLFSFTFCRDHFTSSSSSSSSSSTVLPFDDDGDGDHLQKHHVHLLKKKYSAQVIVLEIQQGAMTKARRRPRDLPATATRELNWVWVEGYAGDDDKSEEFFSVRSFLSRCSSGGGGERWWEEKGGFLRAAAEAMLMSEECFRRCEGWPFGLWQRRRVMPLPPLPSSPSDSWLWREKNVGNARIWAT
ncbi:hypothetical protein HPP92_012725 [Vanilla planifolia]|uniref:Uncharacterized protein n=1 Tax=Vanilla planifolia TaxID=51239 RepID=A0A835QVR0_VANPL|nr:hypothetical protein HPP92_012725 [Vanilla planifolia]